tara:strand:- start:195 stop:827 length:633 start_codon:yes stop_codon:yes gene_type:complete
MNRLDIDEKQSILQKLKMLPKKKNYVRAADTLHKMLQRKVKENDGHWRHALGWYVSKIASGFKGVDNKILQQFYLENYKQIIEADEMVTLRKGKKMVKVPKHRVDFYLDKHYKIVESVTVGDGSGPVNVQKDVPLFTKPNGKAFGSDYFTAPDADTYHNVRLGKNRYKRWDSFVGNGKWGKNVAAFAKANPKSGILVKHPKDPAFMVIRR